MSKRTLLLFFVLTVSNIFSADKEPSERYSWSVHYKFIDWLSSGRLTTALSRCSRSKLELEKKSKYDALFTQAQKEIGIAKKDILPVVDLPFNQEEFDSYNKIKLVTINSESDVKKLATQGEYENQIFCRYNF